MSVDEIIAALKIRVFDDRRGAVGLAEEVGVHPDTIRSILRDPAPGWLQTWKKLEAIAVATKEPATGAVETGGEAHGS